MSLSIVKNVNTINIVIITMLDILLRAASKLMGVVPLKENAKHVTSLCVDS